MNKGKITLIGTIVILFIVIFLFINNSSTKGKISEQPPSKSTEIKFENEKKLKDIEEIQSQLYQEDGLFEYVSQKLTEKGYVFRMMLMVNSKDDIRMKYILANKDATESVKEEVKSIFYAGVESNNLDPNSFNLKVADNNDGPDW